MKTTSMRNWLQIALEVKDYVSNEGRTLSISQGKMLRDPERSFQFEMDKQTA
tara:strand:- start:782 stop:937 length:156 start_codon:yes stop_codon:yes gene_type:complete